MIVNTCLYTHTKKNLFVIYIYNANVKIYIYKYVYLGEYFI